MANSRKTIQYNKRELAKTYLDKLLSQPALSYESAKGMKSIHDTTLECILAIENIEVNTGNW